MICGIGKGGVELLGRGRAELVAVGHDDVEAVELHRGDPRQPPRSSDPSVLPYTAVTGASASSSASSVERPMSPAWRM